MKRTRLICGFVMSTLGVILTASGGQLVTDELDVFGTASFYGDVNIGWESSESGLVLYYDFDTNGISVQDMSGNNNTGTVSGATWSTNGISGGCFYFDGSDYISAGNILNLAGLRSNLTVCAWVKLPAADTSWPYIVSKQNVESPYQGWLLAVHSDQSPFIQARPDNSSISEWTGTSAISNGVWHFLCATYEIRANYSKVTMFWDGVRDGSDTETGSYTTFSNTAAFTIGARDAGASSHFTGYIDEVRVYDRILKDTEIGTLYASHIGIEGSLNVKDLVVDNKLVQTGTGTNILMGPTGIGVTNPVGQLQVGGMLNVDGNIRLNDNWLSGDGDNEGVAVAADGTVTILKLTPQGDIEMGSFTNQP